jgi:hypothetical protein
MTDIALLDRAFYRIMQRFIKTGQAPHHTELAKDLGLGMEEGRQLFHDLMAAGVPGWLHPQTDWIASFPPFNNQPTQYRMTIDGEQKWYDRNPPLPLSGHEPLPVGRTCPSLVFLQPRLCKNLETPCLLGRLVQQSYFSLPGAFGLYLLAQDRRSETGQKGIGSKNALDSFPPEIEVSGRRP